jgi:DNA-binding protein
MENNTIFVGSKPVMNYVLAVVTQFNEGSDSVILRARGKAISRAVDAAEIVRNRFVPNSQIADIQISTEEIENYNNEKTNVSIIEIFIEKGD